MRKQYFMNKEAEKSLQIEFGENRRRRRNQFVI